VVLWSAVEEKRLKEREKEENMPLPGVGNPQRKHMVHKIYLGGPIFL